VAAGEDGREDLIDHGILTDDDFVQFFDHDFMVAVELFQELVEVAFLSQRNNPR
jgi:hypothetical protein